MAGTGSTLWAGWAIHTAYNVQISGICAIQGVFRMLVRSKINRRPDGTWIVQRQNIDGVVYYRPVPATLNACSCQTIDSIVCDQVL